MRLGPSPVPALAPVLAAVVLLILALLAFAAAGQEASAQQPAATPTPTSTPPPLATATAVPPPGATPASTPTVTPGPAFPPPVFAGALPAEGGIALLTLYTTTPVDEFLTVLDAEGCRTRSLATTRDGRFVAYVVGAPEFVNEGFPRRLGAPVALVVRCAPPPVDLPDLGLLPVVTKAVALPPDFRPEDLQPLPAEATMPGAGPQYVTAETAEALGRLLDAARAQGFDLRVRSAYRSYAEQVSTFNYWISVYGQQEAERRSARPGHSEHQLGTTVDLTSATVAWDLDTEFHETPEGDWLARNAPDFGFVESYPAGGEAVTGYRHEPWHFRYIGESHAGWMLVSGLTLTEYLDSLHEEIGGRP